MKKAYGGTCRFVRKAYVAGEVVTFRKLCWAPPSYSTLILSFTKECVICCWMSVLAYSSLLQWSQISQDTSHNFWMSNAIHHKLDFHDFTCFQILSWWLRHLHISHPSIILSHLICHCSLANVSSVPAGISSHTHCSSCDKLSICTSILVPWSFIHLLSFCRLSVHCARVLAARQ